MAMTEYAGWISDLPDVAQGSLQRDDFAALKEAKDEAARRQDAADAAENQVTALRLAGQVPESLGEILARRSQLADRQAGKLDFQQRREAGEIGLIDPVIHRAGPVDGDVDGDGVIDRAMRAAEVRRVARRGQEAAGAMQTAQARRRPPTLADAWASWRRR
jgi:hypothetical protein